MATKLFLLLIFGTSPLASGFALGFTGIEVSSIGIGGGRGKSFILPVMLLRFRLELAGRLLNEAKWDALMVFDMELGRFAVCGRVGNLFVSKARLKPLELFSELRRCICNAVAVPVVVPFVVVIVGFGVCWAGAGGSESVLVDFADLKLFMDRIEATRSSSSGFGSALLSSDFRFSPSNDLRELLLVIERPRPLFSSACAFSSRSISPATVLPFVPSLCSGNS